MAGSQAIADHVAKQKAFNERQGKSIDGLVDDVKSLNDKIAQLQSTQGQITPEDQALLDGIEADGAALADRLEKLDSDTPPAVPTE